MTIASRLAIVACGMLGAWPVRADFTLQYTGNPFVARLCQGGAASCLGDTSWMEITLNFSGTLPVGYTGNVLSLPGVALASGSAAVHGFTAHTNSVVIEDPGLVMQAGSLVAWSVFIGNVNTFTGSNGDISGSSISTQVIPAQAIATQGDTVFFVVGTAFSSGAVNTLGRWTVTTTPPVPLQISTAALPNATSRQPYARTLSASGGSGAGYLWSVVAGTLPTGFSVSSAGLLSSAGPVAAAAQTYLFTAKVTDSAGNSVTQPLAVVVLPVLQIASVNLPNATSGQPYSRTLSATGGSGGGYQWFLAGGSLPGGFTLTQGGVIISGGSPPAAAQAYSFSVEVIDSAVNMATQALSFLVQPALQVTTTTLPGGVNGQPYRAALSAAGGSGPGYTWRVDAGALPGGYSMSPDGVVSSTGKPMAFSDNVAHSFTFTVGVADASLNRVEQSLTLTVNPPPPGVPSIRLAGIVPLYSAATTIQPGSWVSIYGNGLAGGAIQWNGDFPTSLGGASVTINAKPCYLWFVSPSQINCQAPEDTATGTVNVVVTTAGGSATATVTLGQYAPSLSLFSGKYAAAIVVTPGSAGNSGAGYDVVGPSGVFSYPTRPLKAGEIVTLYGVGFGPTNPAVAAGQAFSGAAPCLTTPQLSIGGVPAIVKFAGMAGAGLYQLNVVVPAAGSGDKVVRATAGGVMTPNNIYLTLQ